MSKTILCPMCSEEIEADVKICPHCRENFEGVWRDGKNLVMRKDAELPDRCIKSNLPAETHLERTLYWHPPFIYALVLLSPIIYILVAVFVQKKAKIEVGLTEAWARQRRNAILTAWLFVLGGIGVIVGGFATLQGNAPTVTFIIGIVMFLGGIIYGMVKARVISAVKITEELVTFSGVCDEFLAELPDWEVD